MKKLIITLVLLTACCLAPSGGVAQTDISKAFECETKVPAAQWTASLGKVQSAYKGLKSFTGEFVQDSYLAALDLSEQSQGNVWFGSNGKMRWHYSAPEEQTFVIREHTLWLYQPVDQQIILEDFSQFVLSDLPLAFLMGLGDLTKDFSVGDCCLNKDSYIFSMAPKKSDLPAREEGIQRFKLLVSKKDFLPRGAQVQDLSGNINSVTFLQPVFNQPVNAKLFEFEYPEGVDVSDQRGD